jgi:hypothetical protein
MLTFLACVRNAAAIALSASSRQRRVERSLQEVSFHGFSWFGSEPPSALGL